MYSKEFTNITNMLKLFDEDNIVHFDENLVLFALLKEKSNNKILYPNYFVYSKESQLLTEPVSLVAKIIDTNGINIGYAFKLANLKRSDNLKDNEVSETILLYIISDNISSEIDEFLVEDTLNNENKFSSGYFISNYNSSDSIMELCKQVDRTIELYSFNDDHILLFNNRKFSMMNFTTNDNSKDFKFGNLGVFTEVT